jgi:hypothetical protein
MKLISKEHAGRISLPNGQRIDLVVLGSRAPQEPLTK